jgi:hypothetical protein
VPLPFPFGQKHEDLYTEFYTFMWRDSKTFRNWNILSIKFWHSYQFNL